MIVGYMVWLLICKYLQEGLHTIHHFFWVSTDSFVATSCPYLFYQLTTSWRRLVKNQTVLSKLMCQNPNKYTG